LEDDSDAEDGIPDGTATGTTETTGGEWKMTIRSGHTSRLPSRYQTKIFAAAIMKTATKK
jgi:hypothetical protein